MYVFNIISPLSSHTVHSKNISESKKSGFFVATYLFEKFITEKSGKYKGYPQRTFSGDSYNFGYSDHFPVYLSFVKKL